MYFMKKKKKYIMNESMKYFILQTLLSHTSPVSKNFKKDLVEALAILSDCQKEILFVLDYEKKSKKRRK